MIDDSIDRELAARLNVQPSGDFVARVRTHIESRTRPRMPWLNVRWAATAVAALAVTVGAVIAMQTEKEERRVPASAQGQGRRVAAPSPQDSTPLAPEVLVSPSDGRVVRQLLIAARGGALESTADSSEAAGPLLPPMPITIAPITVEPLAAAADRESGVVQ